MTAMPAPGSGPAILPPLRDDLRVHEAPRRGDGEKGWLIEDPLRQRFFRVGEAAFRLLSVWRPGPAEQVMSAHAARYGAAPSPDDMAAMSAFLAQGELVAQAPGAWKEKAARVLANRQSLLMRLVHSYLFFRVPLFRPQAFLDLVWPWVRTLFGPACAWLLVFTGVLGLWLAGRQWDVFVHTFLDFLSFEGAMTYGASLIVIKSLHELGHAFQARKYGAHVPTIGVAFLVMMPILYTDTTDGWRLPRRQRLMIDAGGIIVELAIAAVATFLWAILEDGPLRSACFAAATMSWLMSLAVNLNPLMRFDGYYLLTDLLDVHNLQDRGFALGRWRMREALFGFGEAPPEPPATRTAAIMTLHAYATWVYRFFLFLGIALLVYHFTLKILGIVLFVIEIGFFILMPVWRELGQWAKRRQLMVWNRQTVRTAFILGLFLTGLLVPWQSSAHVPALLRAGAVQPVHPPAPAILDEVLVRDGQEVREGQLLYRLTAPHLDLKRRAARQRFDLATARLSRLAADARDLSERRVIENERNSAQTEMEALDALEDALEIRARAAGRIANADRLLHPGLWVSTRTRLAVIASQGTPSLFALVPEEAAGRLHEGAKGVFIATEPEMDAVPVTLVALAHDPVTALPGDALDATHGGPVQTSRQPDGTTRLVKTWYAARLEVDDSTPSPRTELAGTLVLDGEARSIGGRFLRRAFAVLVRESGF